MREAVGSQPLTSIIGTKKNSVKLLACRAANAVWVSRKWVENAGR